MKLQTSGFLPTIVALASLSTPAPAQTAARVTGVVKSSAGQAIAGAKIKAVGQNRSQELEATSAGDGAFALPELAADTYQISASAPRYSECAVVVEVGVGQARTIELKLNTLAESTVIAVSKGMVAGEIQAELGVGASNLSRVLGRPLPDIPLNEPDSQARILARQLQHSDEISPQGLRNLAQNPPVFRPAPQPGESLPRRDCRRGRGRRRRRLQDKPKDRRHGGGQTKPGGDQQRAVQLPKRGRQRGVRRRQRRQRPGGGLRRCRPRHQEQAHCNKSAANANRLPAPAGFPRSANQWRGRHPA